MDNYRSKPKPGKNTEISDNESRVGNGVQHTGEDTNEHIGHEYDQRVGEPISAAIIKTRS